MTELPEKPFLTYLEYKLLALMNNKKPLKRSKVGAFVKTTNFNDLDSLDPPLFKNKDIESFIEALAVDGEIGICKIKEVALKLRFDYSTLLPLFDMQGKDSISIEEFVKFLKKFKE